MIEINMEREKPTSRLNEDQLKFIANQLDSNQLEQIGKGLAPLKGKGKSYGALTSRRFTSNRNKGEAEESKSSDFQASIRMQFISIISTFIVGMATVFGSITVATIENQPTGSTIEKQQPLTEYCLEQTESVLELKAKFPDARLNFDYGDGDQCNLAELYNQLPPDGGGGGGGSTY